MGIWYWIIECGKVWIGYLLFLFLWPSVVFHGHLKGKDKGYWLGFCATVPVVICSTVVLILGFFHILWPQVIAVLFYGAFFAALFKGIVRRPFTVPSVKQIKYRCKEVRWKYRENLGEFVVLAVLLLFGICYFTYGAFQLHSYGFEDLYRHHGWIYDLKEGKIFSGGVYPEAMHCFVYCLNALFGLRIYSCLLYLQGIHVAVFLLAGYFLMREIFHWRYTPLLALTLFLTVDVVSADLIYGLFRLQLTLPMEFGLHTQFWCAFYLVRYLKGQHRVMRKGQLSRWYWDENLFLFLMSLTASISTHFYTAMMAFVLCGSFAVFRLKRLFTKERLIPLAASVLCACAIALYPMAGALASGTPMNTEISQAVEAIHGDVARSLENGTLLGGLKIMEKPVLASVFETAAGVYREGYVRLYGTFGAGILLLVTAAGVALCLYSRKKSPEWLRELCAGYPPLLLLTFLFALLYAAPYLGLPGLISDARVCSTGHMMFMALAMMPVDAAFSVSSRYFEDIPMKAVSLSSVAVIYGLTLLTGHFHGYLFYELTRYNAAVETTNQIMETFPEKSYVLVAPTDERYQMMGHGWHQELVTFMSDIQDEAYTFTPANAFFYLEKRPLQYRQPYFFDGPSWLAHTKYKDLYWAEYANRYPNTEAAQAPVIHAAEIPVEEAREEMIAYDDPWLTYIYLPARTILEAKALDWCQKFAALYPEIMEIYYEDDDFVCYYFKQNGDLQYKLQVD